MKINITVESPTIQKRSTHIHIPSYTMDLFKPQYRQRTVFKVSADIQYDLPKIYLAHWFRMFGIPYELPTPIYSSFIFVCRTDLRAGVWVGWVGCHGGLGWAGTDLESSDVFDSIQHDALVSHVNGAPWQMFFSRVSCFSRCSQTQLHVATAFKYWNSQHERPSQIFYVLT